MSIVLASSTEVLRARLSAAVTTSEPTFLFSYGDDGDPRTLGNSPGVMNGTTNVDLVGSPNDGFSRVIKSGFIYNADTASVTIIIEHYDGTTARKIESVTVGAGATLTFGDSGFAIGATSGTVGTTPYDWIIALGDETTAITTGTAKVTVRAPRAMTLSKIKGSLTTAGTGSSAFDVKLNGTSVFSTTLTIDASEKTSETAATAAVLSTTAIAADDELTFDVSTAGTSAAGAKITLVATA